MKFLQTLFILCALVWTTHALTCWICENVRNNDDCLRYGRAQMCQSNQQACQNEVRRGSFGILVTKRCKQALACENNFIQNPRAAWFPSQCNTRTPSSVCRCCCSEDLCNRDSLECLQDEPRGPRNDFCDPIPAPQNGRKQCTFQNSVVPESDEVDVTTECEFTCDEGYQLVGFSQSTCDLNPETQEAQFNRNPPRCTPAVCNPSQVAPANGAVTCTNGNTVSSICAFECEFGFALTGNSFTTCLPSGSWSHVPPSCQRVQCDPPHSDPVNGLVTCTNFNNVESTCRFECFAGFVMEGLPSSLCQADPTDNTAASWTTEAPRCIMVQCVEQVAPTNGNVICTDGRNLDSACQFSCNAGFALNGNDITVCFDDENGDDIGLWTLPPPVCEPIVCTEQVAPNNGNVICTSGGNFGSVCQFTCNAGFLLVGTDVTTCIDDGNNDVIGIWTSPPPVCQPVLCQEQAAPANGSVRCSDGRNLASVCQFTCNSGFALIGSDVTQCFDDGNGDDIGQWNSPTPVCEPILCNVQVAPTNGDVSCPDGVNLGSACQFTCNAGYFLVGSEVNRCFDDGNNDVVGVWTSPPPFCQPVLCQEQVAPTNGNVSCSDGRNLASVCQFICNNGYRLVGSDATTCFDDENNDPIGQWTNPTPTCQQIVCPLLRAPANGDISCSNQNIFGSTCSFTCNADQGFSLFPPEMEESTCRINGDWERPIPCCARNCPPFAVMDLVLVLDSSSSIGDENWRVMTAFIRTFIESFEFSTNFSRLSVIRYNRQVDTASQILFNSYVNNMAGLLAAYNRIPYNGSGTRTGQAVEYVNDVVLTRANGDRPEVQDVVIVITDGRAQDGDLLRQASEELRENGALTYAIGITPNSGSLDTAQLNDIGGSPGNVFVAESGFEGLGEVLQDEISDEVCENRCLEQQ